jgi:hypothetical protein
LRYFTSAGWNHTITLQIQAPFTIGRAIRKQVAETAAMIGRDKAKRAEAARRRTLLLHAFPDQGPVEAIALVDVE